MFTLGDRIRKLRKAKGWSQEELGQRAGGLNKQTINRLELGRNATTGTLFAVAEALGVSAESLMIPSREPEGADRDPVDVSDYRKNDLPVIAEGEATPYGDFFWDTEGVLKDQVEQRMSRPADVRDAKAYGVIVRGDSMEPMFRSGMRLIVSPNVPVGDGDPAYIQLRNGDRLVKLVNRVEGGFVLESVNPAHRSRFVKQDEVEHIHRIAYARFLR